MAHVLPGRKIKKGCDICKEEESNVSLIDMSELLWIQYPNF